MTGPDHTVETKPFRVLIAGAGPMGRHHAQAICRLDAGLAQIVAFVDPDEGARRAASEEFGVPSFSDLQGALSEMAPNVVHICSPPRFHADDAVLCLESGAHVYVEKPVALTSAEARRILSTAERLGLRVAAGHQLLEHPASVVAERYIPFLGDLRHAPSRPVERPPGADPAPPWSSFST
jgi:predicted dehydrogenase